LKTQLTEPLLFTWMGPQ